MPRAIGYVRVSTDKQLDNTSIEKQKEEIELYCKNNNLTLVKIYDEGAESAETMSKRKEFKKLYHHALDREENIEYVIFFKADRIARDNLDALYVYKKITKAKRNLICIADNIDTRDNHAKILYHIMAMIAELEKDNIKFRTSMGMEKNAQNGNFNGGKVYGYYSENKELLLVPDEAKIVRYIFEKYGMDQWGYRKIASDLNKQGILTKNNKFWTITAVKTILTNQVYIGNLKWKNTYRKGKHPRIVDDELWNQTQKIMRLKSYLPQKVHPGSYPLSGLLRCPQCNSPMVQGNSSSRYKYYQCSKNKNSGSCACSSNLINKDYAEQFVFSHFVQEIQSLKFTSSVIKATTQSIASEVEPIEEKLASMKQELIYLESKKERIVGWVCEGTMNELSFKQQMKNIENEEKQLLEFVETLEKQLQQRDRINLSEQISLAFENFDQFFHLMSNEDKKELLHFFIDCIYINNGKTSKDRTVKKIEYNFGYDQLQEKNTCVG
ncbi:recombinase family protein [Evansella tamaricis]|uniref:Recombinase family protein n=1 Tax=Evansella tamaricis TaxID=2069301 RepID=A0ABS6JB40_9BACI|nr:recombinase family protein [Evansella tamaricis]MBU9710897.1 recombinase family protein [Evansella tamaricis]